MPVMQKVPFKKAGHEKEGEPEATGENYQSEKIVGLQLIIGNGNGVTKPADADPAGASEQFAHNCSNNGDTARNTDSDKESRHRMRQL